MRKSTKPAAKAPAPKAPAGRPPFSPVTGDAKSSTSSKGPAKEAPRRRLVDYPRAGRTGVRRWLPSWRLVLGTFLVGVFLVVGFVVAAYMTTTIPAPQDMVRAQTTTVYYADGKTEMGRFAVENREIVDFSTLPEHVGLAVVAAEDKTFFENSGIDPVGTLRALYNNIRYGTRQGGSTLTQQYAERYYQGETRDYLGKFREALLAVKIAQTQDKETILGNYLNTIYFGRGAYGVQAAAKAYFRTDAKDLTVEQAALLAAVIPAPSRFDPRVDPEQAERRWNYVLDRMEEDGYVTAEERAGMTFPKVRSFKQSDTYAGPKGYLLQMVRKELVERSSLTEDELDTRGLRIVTTIDPRIQEAAEDVLDELPEDTPERLRTAIVTIDPADGAILALYGGPDYLERQQNAATQDIAQAGSTFKPFTLVAALEEGVSLRTRYSGRSPAFVEGFPEDRGVRNFGNISYGTIDLVEATAFSVNTVYAQLNVEIGPEKAREVAVRAGVPEDTQDLLDNPANVLGTAAPHPIDMATAYATFAAGGVYHRPFIVREATYLSGGTAYEGATSGERRFEADVIADATFAMTQVVERGTATQVRALGRPVAGKTGSSTNNLSAWFVGFTPQMATAVAMYQPDENGNPEPITPFGGYREITGGTWPTDLWTRYMSAALEGYPIEEFPPRADVGGSASPSPSPSPSEEESEEPEDGETEEPETVTVPSGLEGATVADATARLRNAGFQVSVVERFSDQVAAGRVISVSPASGSAIEPGATVTLTVSKGPRPAPSPKPSPSSPPPSSEPSDPPGGEPSDPPTTEPPGGDDEDDGEAADA